MRVNVEFERSATIRLTDEDIKDVVIALTGLFHLVQNDEDLYYAMCARNSIGEYVSNAPVGVLQRILEELKETS